MPAGGHAAEEQFELLALAADDALEIVEQPAGQRLGLAGVLERRRRSGHGPTLHDGRRG
jgi:hypothetical protein